ncbi:MULTISPECIES: DUF418 domain-containing protein [Paenibacillus]|uniref:DUF418 domain-containing protein n=1 Tax=Paenibacillus TaxID=44249 RepID=UPI0022B8E656|nr:DUF418 domain-containing protein [Paenibacillus caseinilyticus]MCZ8522639.1 DUF418 domain-containing protein [Paenibacillus caseinilyticus]
MSGERLTGLDLARALAILGMILVNYKLAMAAENGGPSWLVELAGVLEGRASALFVMLAGIGFSLMTRRARLGEPGELQKSRILVWKRSLYLLLLGFGLLLLGWSADILHYYALFLFMASFLIQASTRLLTGLAALLLALSQGLLLLLDYRTGWDPSFHAYLDFWSAEGFLRNLWFNGYHPVLPWFAFFLAGMAAGRWPLNETAVRRKALVMGLAAGLGAEGLAWLLRTGLNAELGGEAADYLFGTKPMPPGLFYMISAGGTAVAVIALCLDAADQFRARLPVRALVPAGQMALTHYVLHVLAGLGFLELLGVLENGSLPFALLYGAGFFAGAVLFSLAWQQRFGRGPLEALMRKL